MPKLDWQISPGAAPPAHSQGAWLLLEDASAAGLPYTHMWAHTHPAPGTPRPPSSVRACMCVGALQAPCTQPVRVCRMHARPAACRHSIIQSISQCQSGRPVPASSTNPSERPVACGARPLAAKYFREWNLLRWRCPPSHSTVTSVCPGPSARAALTAPTQLTAAEEPTNRPSLRSR